MTDITEAPMGHNSDPKSRAVTALLAIEADSANLWKHWLDYGEALNDLRHNSGIDPEDDKAFGKLVAAEGLAKLPSQNGTVKRDARLAAMWAAGNPDQLAEVTDANSEVTPKGGFRKWHAKWKAHVAEEVAAIDTTDASKPASGARPALTGAPITKTITIARGAPRSADRRR